MLNSLLHIALLITALLVTPVSASVAAAEPGPVEAADSPSGQGPAMGSAMLSQDSGSADLSMLVVVSLGIMGLIWVRRHTAEL